jgi:hypothetical protein
MYILAGPKFACNFDKTKIKFYRASNAILAKLGKQENPTTTIHLLQAIAFPILSYALESLLLSKTKILRLEHPWSRAFMKVFSTFDNSVVKQCQFFTGTLPLCHQYVIRAMTFYSRLKLLDNYLCREIFSARGQQDIASLAANYDTNIDIFNAEFKGVILSSFMNEANT